MRLSPDGARLLAQLVDDIYVGFAGIVLRLKERVAAVGGISRLEALLPADDDSGCVVEVDVPADCAAPTLRRAYRRGYLGDDAQCPYRGAKEADAWRAGRTASGRAAPVPLAPKRANGVPIDVPSYATSAYCEGREAKRQGRDGDANPFLRRPGRDGGRHTAWQRGWSDA